MPIFEIAKTLLEFALEFSESRPAHDEPAERAASAALVRAVMQHVAFDVVRALVAEGTKASVAVKKDGSFQLHIAEAAVEVKPHEEGFFLEFDGFGVGKRARALLPILDRVQHIPVAILPFDDAVKLAGVMVEKLTALLKAAPG